jgi:hypothetical protein
MENFSPTQAIHAMSRGLGALWQGNRLVLMAHGRWHYLTLSTDAGGIMAVNFMSSDIATDTVNRMLPEALLTRFTDISPNFEAELAGKVLPDAESYRSLLVNGRCRLIIGHTTDTLQEMSGSIDSQINAIQHLMTLGKRGPYLSFR